MSCEEPCGPDCACFELVLVDETEGKALWERKEDGKRIWLPIASISQEEN